MNGNTVQLVYDNRDNEALGIRGGNQCHVLNEVVVEGNAPRAEVTCTGGLWATSESTGQRENIDSWFQEVHRLIYEDGAWRIRGHAGEGPNALRFGVAHPFF